MFTNVLDCPHCHHRFGFDHDGQFPETIVCPQCGENSPYENYSALIFCSDCRAKLQVPLDLLPAAQVSCPKCGSELNLHTQFTGEMSDTTLTPGGGNASSRQMLQDGDYIDKYRVLQLLGKGGMAEVYLAEHLLLKKFCAIKIMRSSIDSADNVGIKRFIREAKLAHQLNHPNIVKVFDVGNDPKTGYMFLAMEYVDGRTLLDCCREQLLSEQELLEVIRTMAEALKVLHETNAVHRDIKPSNIMKTADGVYKLMDLGIAKAGDSSSGGELTLTMERSTIGTPSYASPEQCQSAHKADIRSDIYCLGTTVYHLATGKLPFDGSSPVEIILKVMREEPEPIENLRPDLSAKMVALIKCMMKKDPAHRPQSPDELLEMLSGKKLIPHGNLFIMMDDSEPAEEEIADWSEYKDYDEKKPVVFLKRIWEFIKQLKLMAILRLAILLIAVIYGFHLFRSFQKLALKGNPNASSYDRFVTAVLNDAGSSSDEEEKSQGLATMKYYIYPATSFSYVSPASDFLPSMVRDGVLHMDGVFPMSEEAKNHPGYNYRYANSVVMNTIDPMQFAVSLDCLIHPENKGSLFVCGIDPQCMALNRVDGKLVFEFENKEKIETGQELPVGRWCNIMFHCDQKDGRLRVFVNRNFIGNYHLPGEFKLTDKRFTFYDFKKKTAFRGDVDNLSFARGSFQHLYHTFFVGGVYSKVAYPAAVRNGQISQPGAYIRQRHSVPVRSVVSSPVKPVERNTASSENRDTSTPAGTTPGTKNTSSSSRRAHWVKLPFVQRAYISYEEALQTIRGSNRTLLLLFVNSEDARCNQFLRMLASPQSVIHHNYVLVVLDFARSGNHAVPEDQLHYNQSLRKRFSFPETYPAVALINSQGRHFYSIHQHQFYPGLSRFISRTGVPVHASGPQNVSRGVMVTAPQNVSRRVMVNQTKPVRSISDRLEECRLRLAALERQNDSDWRNKQIAYVKKQISTLQKQAEIHKMSSQNKKQYSARKTAEFKAAAEEYLLKRNQWSGYSAKDIREGKKLLALLKDPGVDPNVYLRNHMNRDQGDPLLYIVGSGGLQYRKDFIDLLCKKNVDPNIPQQYYKKMRCLPPEFIYQGVDDLDNAADVFHYANFRDYNFANKYNKSLYKVKPLQKILLLAPDLNLLSSDQTRRTIMHYAVERFDVDFAEELLLAGFSRGKDVDFYGRTPWTLAYRRADADFMSFLKKRDLETPVTNEDRLQNKLSLAFRNRQLDEIRNLVRSGADIFEDHSQGLNLLQIACIQGDHAIVNTMLQASPVGPALLAARNSQYKNTYAKPFHPLQIAVVNKDIKLFSMLLRYKMNPNIGVFWRYGGVMPLAHFVVFYHFRDRDMSAAQIIDYLHEMRKYGWKINPHHRYYMGRMLSRFVWHIRGKNEQYNKLKFIQIISFFVNNGAEIDPDHYTVKNFLYHFKKDKKFCDQLTRILQNAKRSR